MQMNMFSNMFSIIMSCMLFYESVPHGIGGARSFRLSRFVFLGVAVSPGSVRNHTTAIGLPVVLPVLT